MWHRRTTSTRHGIWAICSDPGGRRTPSRTLRGRRGTVRRHRPVSVDPENLDINKPLNFHYEETTIH